MYNPEPFIHAINEAEKIVNDCFCEDASCNLVLDRLPWGEGRYDTKEHAIEWATQAAKKLGRLFEILHSNNPLNSCYSSHTHWRSSIAANPAPVLDDYEITIRSGDGGFVAELPALKGCSAHGKTREEALANLSAAFDDQRLPQYNSKICAYVLSAAFRRR